MAKRIVTKIGDVFCAEIDGKYKRYFQYIANDMSQLNSSVIRTFKSKYDISACPKIEDIVRDKVDFYSHTVLKIGIELGCWYKIGKSKELGSEKLKEVIFGTTSIASFDKNNNPIIVDPISNWNIWKCNGERIKVGELPPSLKDVVENGYILSYAKIMQRLGSIAYPQ